MFDGDELGRELGQVVDGRLDVGRELLGTLEDGLLEYGSLVGRVLVGELEIGRLEEGIDVGKEDDGNDEGI